MGELQRGEYLPLDECKVNHIYKVRARNCIYGIYVGEGVFLISRYKFGHFIDEELHWDFCDSHGTVQPRCLIRPASDEIVKMIKNESYINLLDVFKDLYKEFEE